MSPCRKLRPQCSLSYLFHLVLSQPSSARPSHLHRSTPSHLSHRPRTPTTATVVILPFTPRLSCPLLWLPWLKGKPLANEPRWWSTDRLRSCWRERICGMSFIGEGLRWLSTDWEGECTQGTNHTHGLFAVLQCRDTMWYLWNLFLVLVQMPLAVVLFVSFCVFFIPIINMFQGITTTWLMLMCIKIVLYLFSISTIPFLLQTHVPRICCGCEWTQAQGQVLHEGGDDLGGQPSVQVPQWTLASCGQCWAPATEWDLHPPWLSQYWGLLDEAWGVLQETQDHQQQRKARKQRKST